MPHIFWPNLITALSKVEKYNSVSHLRRGFSLSSSFWSQAPLLWSSPHLTIKTSLHWTRCAGRRAAKAVKLTWSPEAHITSHFDTMISTTTCPHHQAMLGNSSSLSTVSLFTWSLLTAGLCLAVYHCSSDFTQLHSLSPSLSPAQPAQAASARPDSHTWPEQRSGKCGVMQTLQTLSNMSEGDTTLSGKVVNQ